MSCTATAESSDSSPYVAPPADAETSESPSLPDDARTICSFYLEGRCRFGEACRNVHPPGVAVPRVKAKRVATVSNEPQEGDEKKPRLKTAGDVRKRIQWDPDLAEEHFSVGYLDRFSGVVEKPFAAFTWEHLATVDLDQLAVPQHRIQYYKYRNVKVWDKNERLDLVFGSAGGNTTIKEVMQRVEKELAEKCASGDDSDDDDDAVMVATESGSRQGLISLVSDRQKQAEDPLRATHFYCIRVTDEEVRRRVAVVQEQVVLEDPSLRGCAMPGELLHVTLAMVKLDTSQAINEAGRRLSELRHSLREVFDSQGEAADAREIQARGLDTFGARVLYAKLQVPKSFKAGVDLLRGSLRKISDATITSHFDFVPHLTLFKVNRATARERRTKYINSCLYSDYLHYYFGDIPLNNICLCVIDDQRGPDGFYLTCDKVDF